jgi:hypothetical protein
MEKSPFGSLFLGVLLLVSGWSVPASAGEVPWCADPDPCTDDVLRIRFDATGTSEIRGVRAGDPIQARVTIDVKSDGIAGFAFAIEHDGALLEIPQPTSTEACEEGVEDSGCNPTLHGAHPILEGAGDGRALFTTVGLTKEPGFFCAVVLAWVGNRYLPAGIDDLALCKVTYRAKADLPAGGTRIAFKDGLTPPGAPPLTLSLTIYGDVGKPRLVEDAMAFGAAADPGFSRGDANGNGRITLTDGILLIDNILFRTHVLFACDSMLDANDDGRLNLADPVFLLGCIFLGGPAPSPPFPGCGADATPDTLTCAQPNCG